jgi:hypothetical protein
MWNLLDMNMIARRRTEKGATYALDLDKGQTLQ